MKRTDYRLSRFALTMLVSLAAALLLPKEVFADNNTFTFQGQYTAPACGPRHDFVIGPGTKTIDVVASTLPVNDIVLKLYYGGVLVFQRDTGTSPEPIHYVTGTDLATGTYQVEVCPFEGDAVLTPSDYAIVVIVSEAPVPATRPPYADPVVVLPAPIDSGPAPRYQSHTPSAAQIEAGMTKNSQDEPNIGVNWSSRNVMLQALLQTLRVTFDDQACPQTPPSNWKDVTPLTSQESFDPILFTDHQTNRTFVSHLLLNPFASASSFTDDDGTNWIPSQGAGFGSGVDHQTYGGGPFHAPVPPLPGYRNAVYYCAQDIAFANCALSVDGGLTYGPAVPMYHLEQCAGLHGHVKVGPDGTVYVPNAACLGAIKQNENGMAVSEDNGSTWTIRTVPGTEGGGSDPSVAVDDGGLLYLGFVNYDRFPSVAVSADKGKTWINVHDVGAMVGVKNAVFPAVVAGSAGRAAMTFYGTAEEGTEDVSVHDFNSEGIWYLYVAHTYDGGAHWITVNATPDDPLQRGGLHLGGGSHIHRNLLDFFDADTDRFGRMTIGYADGCLGTCVQTSDDARGNSYTAYGTIARQTGGRRLFFDSDPTQPTVPGAPRLTATRNGSISTLTWSQSEDGGSPITGYKVYRSAGGPEQLIATLGGNARRYVDGSGDAITEYTYRVSATNAVGTSCGTNAAISKPAGSSCGASGLRILDDPSGDQIGAPLEPDMDIQWVSLGEPFFADGSRKLVFKLKVASLASLAPNRMWRILWSYPDAPVAPNPSSDAFVGRYYIGMNTGIDGAVTFEYGIAQVLSLVVANAAPAERFGNADPASGFSPDGTITLVISADKVGGPEPGDLIGGLIARSYPVAQDITLRGDTASDVTSVGNTYALVGNAFCAPPPTVDLQVSNIVAANAKPKEGDRVTLTATISNTGTGNVGASQTEFLLDGATVLGQVDTAGIAAGGSFNASIAWDTRGLNGSHTIRVTADKTGLIAESNESNNAGVFTATVQGNKVKNGSFEQANSSGSAPEGWSGSSTGAGNATWSDGGSDGNKSASTSGNGGNAATSGSPSWTSDPITVTAGEVLTLRVSVESVSASSAATAGLAYLGAAGNVLSTVNLITAPLTTTGFAVLQQTVTIPAGVTQVRVKLTGFAPTDSRTSGTVSFDDVGLFAN